MSVIIRLQNLPWSANALDIRNYFRGLSIPEGGVHIVGGELGDAFIAFSTDEDARQAMMLDGGKIKEIQVKLLLSSRSEMHKVIETARQTVPLLSLAPAPPVVTAAPAVIPPPVTPAPPPAPTIQPAVITPFSAALGNNPLSNFGIPGLGNPQEIPQPAVIELPPHVSPNDNALIVEDDSDDKLFETKRKEKDRRRSRTRSRSRDRERKDRKRDRRDRSRSRDRRRRDRSRSREGRRDRKRDRKDRSRSRDRSLTRRPRDRRKSPSHSQEKESPIPDNAIVNPFNNPGNLPPQLQQMLQMQGNPIQNAVSAQESSRFNEASVAEAMSKVQELAKKRNPNAFQGDQNGGKQGPGRGGMQRGGGFQRERRSRFGPDESARDCCVAIRNAPTHTSYGDVRRFFPFMIDKHGIKMINDNMGRRTGNIYVRFTEHRSKQLSLQRKNNELKGAQVTVEDLDDETYDAAIDSYLPFRDDDGEDPSLVVAEMQERARPFTVLKLTDMPHYIKEHDIIKTFNEFSLLSITLADCRVSRSKVALVQFAKPEEARMAFERKERYAFGRRQITIVSLTDEEFEKEKTAINAKNDVVRPQEEPPQEVASPRDPRQRRQFDNGVPPPTMPAQGLQGPQGAPFFVPPFQQNPNFPPAQNPVFPQSGQFAQQFGGFPGPANLDPRTAASNWANRPQFPSQIDPTPGAMKKSILPLPTDADDEPLDCVLMKGLPRDATDRTIVSFLSDTGAVPARIHLMLDGAGQPSGDCFCEFRSTQEARLAAAKHGDNLEGCRVTVDIVPRSVVEEALEGPKQIDMLPADSLLGPGGPGGPGPAPMPFFDQNPMGRGGFNGRGSFRGRGGFDRGGYDRGFDRGGYGGRGFDSGRGSFRSRGGFNDRGGRGYDRGRGRGRGGINNYENGSRGGGMDDNDVLEDFGSPGCVVSMENVPFRATIDEIMQFFSEFELSQDDIIRRYNERGQPTGDARVAFRTPFDAQRAVKTRHMDNIHDRRISLNIL